MSTVQRALGRNLILHSMRGSPARCQRAKAALAIIRTNKGAECDGQSWPLIAILEEMVSGVFWYRYGDSNPGSVVENHVS